MDSADFKEQDLESCFSLSEDEDAPKSAGGKIGTNLSMLNSFINGQEKLDRDRGRMGSIISGIMSQTEVSGQTISLNETRRSLHKNETIKSAGTEQSEGKDYVAQLTLSPKAKVKA
jgi:hypothetical protein